MMTLEMAKRSESEWFKLHWWEKTPALVLGVRFAPIQTEWRRSDDGSSDQYCTTWKWNHYRFAPGREFVPISHQTAGHACQHHHLWVSELSPTVEGHSLINDVCRWDGSCTGMWGVSFDELVEYRATLRRYGVDCNKAYDDFEEAIYPIDCSTEALKLLASDALPEDLDDLIEWDSELSKLSGCMGRWGLYVLGDNCD
jgi:hypothetical protein